MPEASHFVEHRIVSIADVQAQMRHWFPKSVSFKKKNTPFRNSEYKSKNDLINPQSQGHAGKICVSPAAVLDSYFRNLDA